MKFLIFILTVVCLSDPNMDIFQGYTFLLRVPINRTEELMKIKGPIIVDNYRIQWIHLEDLANKKELIYGLVGLKSRKFWEEFGYLVVEIHMTHSFDYYLHERTAFRIVLKLNGHITLRTRIMNSRLFVSLRRRIITTLEGCYLERKAREEEQKSLISTICDYYLPHIQRTEANFDKLENKYEDLYSKAVSYMEKHYLYLARRIVKDFLEGQPSKWSAMYTSHTLKGYYSPEYTHEGCVVEFKTALEEITDRRNFAINAIFEIFNKVYDLGEGIIQIEKYDISCARRMMKTKNTVDCVLSSDKMVFFTLKEYSNIRYYINHYNFYDKNMRKVKEDIDERKKLIRIPYDELITYNVKYFVITLEGGRQIKTDLYEHIPSLFMHG